MSSPALPHTATSPTQSRPVIDPLAFDNVRGLQGTQESIGARQRNGYQAEEAEEDNGDEGVQRVRRGPTGVNIDDIPRMKDKLGESIMNTFISFLEE
jgi:DNA replication licensing factor MCM6